MNLYSLLQKYRNASVTFKATIWYTICNMLQKVAAFLIIPFLTRMLSTADYGQYTVFLSWVDIIEIFATMRMYSNGYVAGLVKNSEDQERYTCSVQFISLVTTVACFGIFCLFSNQVSSLLQMEPVFINYMFFSFFATSSIGIWSSRQRVRNKYKLMVLVTLLYSVLAPIASIAGAYISEDKLETVIEVRVLTQFIISVPFFLMNLLGKNKVIVWKYCKGALTYNIPLVPYYLSMVLLNSSDRIMIKNIVGETEAGIYGVAYSLSMAISVFMGALNLSLQPWIFTKFKNKTPGDAGKVMGVAVCFIAGLNLCVLITSPELITIVASVKYAEAVWLMPPIICSLLVMFIYQQILNIHFYFGENKIIVIASMVAAGLNLILNYIFIHLFGYIAAGYTTLVSYTVIMVMYYISMKKIAVREAIDYRKYYNTPLMFGVLVAFAILTVLVTFLYPYPVIRYLIVLIGCFMCLIFRKRILAFVKKLGLAKGNMNK